MLVLRRRVVMSRPSWSLFPSDERHDYRQRFLPSEPAADHDDRSAAAGFGLQ